MLRKRINEPSNLSEMLEIKTGVESKLLQRPGVNGVDVGFKYIGGKKTEEIVIRVFVKEKKDVPYNERIPETIQSVKTDVIQRTFVLQSLRVPITEFIPQADTRSYNPLIGGIGIGPCRVINGFVYVGTLGAIVNDNATGNPMLLSNFHVMCVDNGWRPGDTIVQPSRVDGGNCPAEIVGTLSRASVGGQVDCAVADITARSSVCDIVDIGNVSGIEYPIHDMTVRKRGYTTGLTYGSVDGIGLTLSIDYGDGIGTVTLKNQITIRAIKKLNPKFSDHGDSGSVVLNDASAVIGLLFAGSSEEPAISIANPIQAVIDALNVNICTSSIAPTFVPLYRYWSSGGTDHFYTTHWNELGIGNYGWGYEGIQCYVCLQQQQGTVPLYRYWNPGISDHFYTTNWDELETGNNGWSYEGIQCYVHSQQQQGTVPLYRYWNPGVGDHFYTTNWGELGGGNNEWNYEGIQCYVPTRYIGGPLSTKITAISTPEISSQQSIPWTFRVTHDEPTGKTDLISETFKTRFEAKPSQGSSSFQ